MKNKIIRIRKNNDNIYVRSDLLGGESSYDLCSCCKVNRCPERDDLNALRIVRKLTAVVWECPNYKEK